MNINDIIIKPIITEKSSSLLENNVYSFEVNKRATKTDVKKAILIIFANSNVKISKIRMQVVKPKAKRLGKYEGKTKGYKKAMIYLSEGSIPIYGSQGVENNEKGKKKSLKIINTDKILNDK